MPGERRAPGFFFDAVRVLEPCSGDDRSEEGAAYVDAVERFDPACEAPGELIHQLCLASAERYLENPQSRIAYVHCLTAPSALRLLGPHLDAAATRLAIGHAMQAALALHVVSAVSASAPLAPSAEVTRPSEDIDEVRYRAACSLEEHAIKFVEACLRENAASPHPVFRLAAADAAIHMDSGQGRGAAC